MMVKDIMTKTPETLRPNDSMEACLKAFTKNKISGCLVVSANRVVGIVTQSDIINAIDVHAKIHESADLFPLIKAAIKNEKFDALKTPIRKLLKKPVKEFMKSPVITVDYEEDAYTAARIINEHDIERLPVLCKKKLVGIVTRTDIINVLEKMGKGK